MSLLEKSILDIRNLDLVARGTSWLHTLDSRAKLVTTMAFIVAVVSVDKYAVAQLIPFLIYPTVLVAIGNIPTGYILKKIVLVAPFALMVGLFNPLLDRTVLLHLGPWDISGGWISLFSLLFRVGLTVGTALILIALTSFTGICFALEKMMVPKVFVTQLLFLYRYLFVLVDEAGRMNRARSLRTFDTRGPGLKTYSSMIGYLLLKATSRSERIHLAMRCRGFDGTVRMMTESRFGGREIIFVGGWVLLFLLFRLYNLPHIIGTSVTGLLT